jgi:hypothetical protein
MLQFLSFGEGSKGTQSAFVQGCACKQALFAGIGLGMSEYAQRFAEERIEIDVLPELTDQDLDRDPGSNKTDFPGARAERSCCSGSNRAPDFQRSAGSGISFDGSHHGQRPNRVPP